MFNMFNMFNILTINMFTMFIMLNILTITMFIRFFLSLPTISASLLLLSLISHPTTPPFRISFVITH